MNREIPENVYNAVKTLSDFCVKHNCDDCPFGRLADSKQRLYDCIMYQVRPSYWSVVKETVFKVNLYE